MRSVKAGSSLDVLSASREVWLVVVVVVIVEVRRVVAVVFKFAVLHAIELHLAVPLLAEERLQRAHLNLDDRRISVQRDVGEGVREHLRGEKR